MAQIENGDVLRIATSLLYDGVHEITNVWHVLVTSGGEKTFLEIVDDIKEYVDLLFDDIDTILVTEITADSIGVSNATQTLVFGQIDFGVFAQGGDANEPTAAGACCLAFGRTYKPRVQIKKYFGVFARSSLTAGLWIAAARDAVALSMAAHVTEQVLTDGLTLLGVAYNRDLGTYELVQSTVVRAEPAYQRRRTRGRGS